MHIAINGAGKNDAGKNDAGKKAAPSRRLTDVGHDVRVANRGGRRAP
jgi:hypothetical protein